MASSDTGGATQMMGTQVFYSLKLNIFVGGKDMLFSSSAWWEEDHRSFLQWIEHLSPDIFLGGHCCREVYPLHSFLMDKFSFARRLAEKPTIVIAIVCVCICMYLYSRNCCEHLNCTAGC